MNQFSAKKLGEVLAFCRVGVETAQKGDEALRSVWGEKLDSYTKSLQEQAEAIEHLAQSSDKKEVTFTKAEGTSSKLRAMRDMYVGDEWDNSAELLEWLGFFEGAAIVHWALVEGVAVTLEMSELEDLASEAKDFHLATLDAVCDGLAQVGHTRAKE